MLDLTRSNLYRLFIREEPGAWATILFAALVAGLMQGAIVVILNQAAGAIAADHLNLRYLLMFLLVLGAYALASHFSTSRTVALTEGRIFALYTGIAGKLQHAALIHFERLGKGRIHTTLHTNTDLILETSKGLAGVGAAWVMILFCFVYIGYLSGTALLVVAAFYAFGLFVYSVNFDRLRPLLREAGTLEERFKALFTAFVEGFKEIKVSRRKGADLLDNHIRPVGDAAYEARVRAEGNLTANAVFIQSFYYILVAAMIFLLPRLGGISHATTLQVAVVVLFSYGSATRIVQAIPLILKAERAVGALQDLERSLEEAQDGDAPYHGRFAHLPTEERSIRLEGVCFDYEESGEGNGPRAFTLGPLSLEIPPGELLFIVGGNGSGKTTLLKLLAGLYAPKEGSLHLGSHLIDAENYADYRNQFAVLFPDYYLFDRFYGHGTPDEAGLEEGLRAMELTGKVPWSDGRFGNLHLSSGQRKRLALICAELEARPILILDEVAADLDPAFRRYFYETHLPRLKAAGKTVIAVSHDEKYFHVADRVVKLDAGTVSA
ncbi:cyclic peptide export ABC transporter [Endothiovibrio diazotrophicus]